MDDGRIRELEAQLSSLSFIAEHALTVALLLKSPAVRSQLVSSIRAAVGHADNLRVGDGQDPERTADILARAQARTHVALNRVAQKVGVKPE